MIDAANGTGIEAGIRTRVLPANSISTTGSAHIASFAVLAEAASGGAINTWAKAVTPGELLPPPVDLIGADLCPTRHVGDSRTRLQARRDNRPLLLIAQAPPTLGAGDYLNSRHRTIANTVVCTDASNSPNRRRSARRPSPERYVESTSALPRHTFVHTRRVDRESAFSGRQYDGAPGLPTRSSGTRSLEQSLHNYFIFVRRVADRPAL